MSITLTKSQSQALETLLSGSNCFIDGMAGTGKTFLLDYYTKYYCQDKKVLKCCFTANAVNNLTLDKDGDGLGTIHTIFHLGSLPSVIDPYKNPPRTLGKKEFSQYDIIIIDEISMCRIDYFLYISKIIDRANVYRNKPIQLIVAGDFGQLPPIMTNQEKKILVRKYDTDTCYPFEHDCWNYWHFKTIVLKDNIRIQDQEYLNYLKKLRVGKDLNKVLAYFNKRVKHTKAIANTIRLFATNRLVDKTNKACLESLHGKQISIPAYYDHEIKQAIKHHQLSPSDLPGSLVLTLKPKAQVMFIKNDKQTKDKPRRFVNGDLGIVESCTTIDEVIVKVLRTNKLVRLHKYNLASTINKQPKLLLDIIVQDQYIGLYKQYPIKLAYALTIHKAQGKTFNKVILNPNIDKAKLTPGLVYVALSRTRSINNLYLEHKLTLEQIKLEDKVIQFYQALTKTI